MFLLIIFEHKITRWALRRKLYSFVQVIKQVCVKSFVSTRKSSSLCTDHSFRRCNHRPVTGRFATRFPKGYRCPQQNSRVH